MHLRQFSRLSQCVRFIDCGESQASFFASAILFRDGNEDTGMPQKLVSSFHQLLRSLAPANSGKTIQQEALLYSKWVSKCRGEFSFPVPTSPAKINKGGRPKRRSRAGNRVLCLSVLHFSKRSGRSKASASFSSRSFNGIKTNESFISLIKLASGKVTTVSKDRRYSCCV